MINGANPTKRRNVAQHTVTPKSGVHFYATEKAEMDFLFASKIDA
jgi:hypothetical protein